MKQKLSVQCSVGLLACFAVLSSIWQNTQAFPDRPIRIVVPSPPGGPPDIMARLLTDEMSAALGQPVIVENRAGGAAGMIGAKSVLAADPDGYTLLIGSTSTLLIAPLIYKNAGYNAQSFAPIAGLSESAEVLTRTAHLAGPLGRRTGQRWRRRNRACCITARPASVRSRISKANCLKSARTSTWSTCPIAAAARHLSGYWAVRFRFSSPAVTQMLPYIRDGRLLRFGGHQREAQSAGAGNSNDGGELLRSVRDGIDQFHRSRTARNTACL